MMKKRRNILLLGLAFIPVIIPLAGWGMWEYYETPQFCGNTCHIMQPYVESWQGEDLSAAAHAAAGVTCLDCHLPTREEQVEQIKMYINGDYDLPLETRTYDNNWCFRCHEHGSYDEIRELTAHYKETLNRNPHQPPHFTDMACHACHKMHQPGEIYCNQCHNFPAPGSAWKDLPPPDNPTP